MAMNPHASWAGHVHPKKVLRLIAIFCHMSYPMYDLNLMITMNVGLFNSGNSCNTIIIACNSACMHALTLPEEELYSENLA